MYNDSYNIMQVGHIHGFKISLVVRVALTLLASGHTCTSFGKGSHPYKGCRLAEVLGPP